jgi:hypothetical protein
MFGLCNLRGQRTTEEKAEKAKYMFVILCIGLLDSFRTLRAQPVDLASLKRSLILRHRMQPLKLELASELGTLWMRSVVEEEARLSTLWM